MNPGQQLLKILKRHIGNPLLAELTLFAILIAANWLLSWLLARLLVYAVTRWMTPFETEQGAEFDASIRRLRAPLTLLLFAVSFQLSLPALLSSYAGGALIHLALVISIVSASWLLIRFTRSLELLLSNWIDLHTTDNLDARKVYTQLRAFRNIANFLVLLLTVGFVLLTFETVQEFGTGLLASAGVAGIILGFAAQRSLSTVMAGVQIAMTQPIRVDDVVIVEGEWGRIEEITLTYVVVRIWDLRRLVVPVSYFLDQAFQNWTRTSAELLGTVELYVDYSVPVEALREETKRLLEASDNWDGKVWSVQVTTSNEKAMVVRPLFSAADASILWNLRCEMREKLIAFLQKNYPQSLPRVRANVSQVAA